MAKALVIVDRGVVLPEPEPVDVDSADDGTSEQLNVTDTNDAPA